jgi:peptidyl-tRNA hydrolase
VHCECVWFHRVDSADELLELVSRAPTVPAATSPSPASVVGVVSTIISDAGRTQVAAGSVTVAAFLGSKSEVDAVTGHLKLL